MQEMTEKLNTLPADWMSAIWNASVQGGLALLVVWCICRFVPRISPGFKVWLWRLAWFKLLFTLFWTGSIDLPLLGPVSHPPAAVQSLPAVTIPQTPPVDPPGVSGASLNSQAVLFVAWLIAVFCWVLHLGYQWSRSACLRRSAPPLKNSGLAQLCSKLRIARAPGLRESSEISSPVLIGILRPTIIVPRRRLLASNCR